MPLMRKAGSSALLRVGSALAGAAACCCGEIEISEDDCTMCSPDTASVWYAATISGITDSTCSVCSSLNGLFVLQQQSNPCRWQYNYPSPICANNCGSGTACRYDSLVLALAGTPGGSAFITVSIQASCSPHTVIDNAKTIRFRKEYTNGNWPVSCLFESLDVPLFQNSDCGGGARLCQASGATCTITAIPPP